MVKGQAMKSSPRQIIKAHYETYVDASTEKVRWQDHATFEGVPVLVFGLCLSLGVELSGGASTALLTVSGLLSAFLFGVMLQVSQRAMEWAAEGPTPSHDTSAHAIFLREIAANAGYAALVSIVTAMVFVVANVTTKTPLLISSAIGLALGVHMVMVLLMVMNRVFAVTENRLTRARTGSSKGNVTQIERRRSAR
jgi:hypothetical protein